MSNNRVFVLQFYTRNVPYGAYAESINKKCCEEKGYEYYAEKDDSKLRKIAEDRAFTWIKPKLISEHLENYDYVLFMDIDAIFSDHSVRIEEFIDEEFDLVAAEDYSTHSKMNAGVLLFKNSDWSKKFLRDWWDSGENLRGADIEGLGGGEEKGHFKNALWHDQTCLTHLYSMEENKRQIKIIDNRSFNWREYGDGNFIFHAFSYGHLRNRTIDKIYHKKFGIKIDPSNKGLVEIAEFYGTDKEHAHNYMSNHYERILSPVRDKVKRVCEVGVGDGSSLETWRDYFPKAVIVGCDISDKAHSDPRIELTKMDQGSDEDLDAFCSSQDDFDLIIDDGSHKMKDQQVTLAKLFKKLKPGGIYILEDLHTSVEAKMPEKYVFGWGDPEKTITLDMLEEFVETGRMRSDYMNAEEMKYLEKNIEFCEILRKNENYYSITSEIRKKS
jgi:SAM-dependent methyltransferase